MVKKEFYENPRIPRYPNTGFQKALNLFSILALVLTFPLSFTEMESDSGYHHYPLGLQRPAGRLGAKRHDLDHTGSQSGPLSASDHAGKVSLCLERACQNYAEKSKVGLSKHKNHADPYEISHDSRICRHYIPQCSGKESERSAYSPVSGLPFRFHDLFHYKERPKTPQKIPLRNSPLVLYLFQQDLISPSA